MPLEVEAKIKTDSHEAVRSRLAEVGGRRLGCVLESNHIFNRADGSLWASGCGLRVRHCRAIEGGAPPATMTFKGPLLEGELKLRQEIEIAVDDPTKAVALLKALGFVEALYFEKRRESWQLDDCHVELDELPHLGCYVEIEGPDEARVRSVQRALGLADEASIRDSYIALLIRHCQQHRIPAGHITFDDRGRLAPDKPGAAVRQGRIAQEGDV